MLRNFIIIIRQLTDADRMKLVWILKTPPPLEWVGYSPQFLRDRPLHDEWYRWLRGGCGGLVHRRVFLGAATCYERLPCYRAASLERRLPKKDVVTGPFAHDCMVAVKTKNHDWCTEVFSKNFLYSWGDYCGQFLCWLCLDCFLVQCCCFV